MDKWIPISDNQGRPCPPDYNQAITTAYVNAGQPYGNDREACRCWTWEQVCKAQRMDVAMAEVEKELQARERTT